MPKKKLSLLSLFLVGSGLMSLAGAQQVLAASYGSDFESFTLGDVNGQDGWMSGHGSSFCPVYDVAIVSNTYGLPSLGTQSLRISNAITCGSFNDMTFSRSLTDEAGETSASTSVYSGGVRQPYFETQWDFASTVPNAEQPDLSVVASADRGDPGRMTWLQMTDSPTGLQLNFEDYQRSVTNFVLTPIAVSLDRTVPHTVKLTAEFIAGDSNDVVKVYLDGVLIHTGTTWEDYFRDFAGGIPHPVDSMMFRTAGTAVPANSGKGFLIDNFTSYSGPVPSPPPPPPASGGGARTGTIIVIKRVVNDDGGIKTASDFPLYVNGTPVVSGASNDFQAPADAYAVTETGDVGYARTFSGDCDASGRLTLSPGDNKLCVVTNDDVRASGGEPPVPPLLDVTKMPDPVALPAGGGQVTYTYALHNLGTVSVTGVTMDDDSCGPVTLVSGDADADGKLGVSEIWIYRCSATLSGTHTNTVVASGWANGLSVSDLASATVVVGLQPVPPQIHVTKVPSPMVTPAGGGMVTYTEKVTNPGTTALSGVRLTDDACAPVTYVSGDTDGDSMLDISESWVFTCQTRVLTTVANTVVAVGEAGGMVTRDFAVATVIVPPVASSVLYGVVQALASATTIDIDKGLSPPAFGTVTHCVTGDLMKLADDGNPATQSDTTVYGCGLDGNRYVFPDRGTYASWYKDFSGVRIVSGETLAALSLAGNVTYRPGSRLLKVESDPRVYAVAKGGVLRWVTSETVARALYGAGWNRLVTDIPVSLFAGSYRIGDPIVLGDVVHGETSSAIACLVARAFTGDLAVGSETSEVRSLQELLQCLGDFPPDIAPNGYYGPATKGAVKAFQASNGIAPVGRVGPETREALNRYVDR